MDIKKVESENDCEKLVPLLIDVFSEEPYNEKWTPEMARRRIVETWMRGADFCFYAVNGGDIIGLILSSTQSWEDGDHIIIEDCAVRSSHRRKGIGKRLVAYLENEAKNKGIVSIEGLVNKDAAAMHFWKESGYVPNGYIQLRKIL